MLPKTVEVPLNKIRPNPWRDLTLNPIDNEQVKVLKGSIKATKEFWVGVYGRETEDGFIELAFGHKRLAAARGLKESKESEELLAAELAGLKAIPVTIRKFTDGQMLQRMVYENGCRKGGIDFRTALEAVSAAVKALAEGKIGVPAPGPDTNKMHIRVAPSFVPGTPSDSESERPYTASTLAVFLGEAYYNVAKRKSNSTDDPKPQKIVSSLEPQNSVKAALSVLELFERFKGVCKEKNVTLSYFDSRPLVGIKAEASRLIKLYEDLQAKRVLDAEAYTKHHAAQIEAERAAKEAEKSKEDARIAKRIADGTKKNEKEYKENQERKRLAQEKRDQDEAEAEEARKEMGVTESTYKETTTQREKAEEAAAYMNIRTDVENVLGQVRHIAEEHGALWALVNSLNNRPTKLPDRQRIWDACKLAAERCEMLGERLDNLDKTSKEKS